MENIFRIENWIIFILCLLWFIYKCRWCVPMYQWFIWILLVPVHSFQISLNPLWFYPGTFQNYSQCNFNCNFHLPLFSPFPLHSAWRGFVICWIQRWPMNECNNINNLPKRFIADYLLHQNSCLWTEFGYWVLNASMFSAWNICLVLQKLYTHVAVHLKCKFWISWACLFILKHSSHKNKLFKNFPILC